MQTASRPIPIKGGKGAYLITEDHTHYLDAFSSWWVNLHGHTHPDLIAALSKQAQQLVVLLPDKPVTSFVGTPYAGAFFYFSGSGNNLDNHMTRSVVVPAGLVQLTAKVRYDIELDWDYAYLTVNGNPVHTNRSTNTNPNGQNFGEGITGSSGGNWVDLTADLSAYADLKGA